MTLCARTICGIRGFERDVFMRTVLEKNSLTQPRLLILGAAGRFGAEACRALTTRVGLYFAQARKGLAPNLLERVQFIHADVLEYQTILEQLQQRGVRIDLIVHALNPDSCNAGTDCCRRLLKRCLPLLKQQALPL